MASIGGMCQLIEVVCHARQLTKVVCIFRCEAGFKLVVEAFEPGKFCFSQAMSISHFGNDPELCFCIVKRKLLLSFDCFRRP